MRNKMKKIYALLSSHYAHSKTATLLSAVAALCSRIFGASLLVRWFTKSDPYRAENFLSRFVTKLHTGKLGDFIRSGVLLRFAVDAANAAWRLPLWVYGNFLGMLGLGLFFGGGSKWFLLCTLLGIALQWSQKDLRAFCTSSLLLRALPAFAEAPDETHPTLRLQWYWYIIASALGLMVGGAAHFIGVKLAVLAAAALLLLPFLLGSPFICLLVSVWGAMGLPTLYVMLLSLLTFAVTILHWFFDKEKMPKITSSGVFWFLLCAITLLYTCFGFGGTNGFLAGGIRLAMMPTLLTAWILLSSKRRIMKLCLSLVGGGCLVGIYGIYQYLTGGASAQWTDTALFGRYFGRIVATFENPNIYGEFLLLLLPLCAALFLTSRKKSVKLFALGAALLLAVNMALTYSRGCYVALALSVVVMLWFVDKRWLIPLGVLLLLSPLYLPDSIMTRLQSIGNMSDTSTLYRVQIWQGTLAMLKQYWWIGAGFGSVAFSALYDQFALATIDAPHAHNLLLQTICESGIVGLICTVGMLVCIGRDCLTSLRTLTDRPLRYIQIALFSAWCGLALQGVFDYTFYNNNLFLIMMCTLGLMLALARKEFQTDES